MAPLKPPGVAGSGPLRRRTDHPYNAAALPQRDDSWSPDVGSVHGKLDVVNWRIRRYKPSDEEPVVELSFRAWAPVFASLEEVLEIEIFRRLHPDWRVDQDEAVRAVLVNPAMQIWVAEAPAEAGPTGFVAAKLNADSLIGEVYMLAVDPVIQDQGVGTSLTGIGHRLVALVGNAESR